MITKKETESEGYIIMNRNSDILILLLLLALLAELRQTEAGTYAQTWPDPNISPAFSQTAAPTSFYGRPGRLRMPEPARLIGDFHRMTEVMGKVDHLGQMAVNPPKLPEPAELINTSALPDLSSMAEMLGPLLGKLGNGNTEN